MARTRRIEHLHGTREYVFGYVDEASGKDLSLSVITIAVHVGPAEDVAGAGWLPAVWDVDENLEPCIRTQDPVDFSSANYPYDSYRVTARVGDTSETPLVSLGTLHLRQ